MTIFIDTSALLAMLDRKDPAHEAAKQLWADLVNGKQDIVCTNYVLVETVALAQRRLGIQAVRALHESVTPVLHIEWVDERSHYDSMNALLTASLRQLSLVDCCSFICMRRLGIRTAFAFDAHFVDQGFECVPATRRSKS